MVRIGQGMQSVEKAQSNRDIWVLDCPGRGGASMIPAWSSREGGLGASGSKGRKAGWVG